jgi:hypothetical protein
MSMKTQVLWGLLLATAAAGAQADTTALQRCRIVAEAAARLACYDAIALPGVGSRAGWGAPVAGAAPATAPAPGTSASSPASSFGLPATQAAAEADQLESRIVGLVETFPKGTRYRLENGQVWQITETTMGFYQLSNPKVTISRGLLGNFYLQIEGVAATPKVRRVQ